MMSEHFDAVIIGTGQGGDPLARAYAGAGKKTAIIERADVGGSCINFGCTPTKTMVHCAKVARMVSQAQEYGVKAQFEGIDFKKIRDLKRGIVEEFRSETEKGILAVKGLELIYGQAKFVGKRKLEIALKKGGTRSITATEIFINTGLRPLLPPIPGLDKVPFLTNKSIMELDDLPEHLVILGAGYIGLEFGQMFRRFGSRVTIVEHGNRLLPHEDPDIAAEVVKILKGEGIDIQVDTLVTQVSGGTGAITLSMSKGAIKGTALLLATGQTPNTQDLGAETAGIKLDERGYVKTNGRLATSAKGVYALGDVKGGPAFTHISYDDFRVLKSNLLDGKKRTIKNRPVPYVMFIDPELGRIGLNEVQAAAEGIEVDVAVMRMSDVARADEMNEKQGFIKVLVDKKSKQILGASVLGVEGGEIMSMFELAMKAKLTLEDLDQMIFAHPTLAELLNNVGRNIR
jgi:pyruvate/2-oxoglutarate dehydrogenase complex dihydrolipoamide dehydrogenase (E3) component